MYIYRQMCVCLCVCLCVCARAHGIQYSLHDLYGFAFFVVFNSSYF